MKRIVCPAMALAAGLMSLRAATEPVYAERFNSDAPAIDFRNGSQQGAGGSGVSGKPADRAYVATFDPANGGSVPPPGAIAENLVLPTEMAQFTVTVWYKADRDVQEPDTLFHLASFYLLCSRGGGWTMRLPQWIITGPRGPLIQWTAQGEWVFYAITWDLQTQKATVYQGTALDGARAQQEFPTPNMKDPLGVGGPAIIGNDWTDKSRGPSNRPFSGSIDNIRIYDKALSDEAIEAIRTADLENAEPKLP